MTSVRKLPSTKPATARAGKGSGDVLGVRALNRAVLERQMRLRRCKMPVSDAIEHLVGCRPRHPIHRMSDGGRGWTVSSLRAWPT
jgi:hypothetical protein